MKRNLLLCSVVLLLALFVNGCDKDIKVYSPDKNICVIVDDSTMTVKYKRQVVQVVKVDIGKMDRCDWTEKEPHFTEYSMVSGKRAYCSGAWNLLRYKAVDGRQLIMRIYNDGIAFLIADGEENIRYVIPDGQKRWLQNLKTDYEGFYPESSSAKDGKYAYPALIEYGNGIFGLITESGIGHGNSCSYLTCRGQEYAVTFTDSMDRNDNPGFYFSSNDNESRVTIPGMEPARDPEYVHPWRIIMLGTLADIVESTLVTNVAEPCRIGDVSWIKPGVSSWIYWAYNHSSKDFEKVKEYIDLAHDMGWPYSLIDWEWDEMANGGNIDDAMAYARERGVKINLWYNSGTSWVGRGAPGPQDRLRTREAREREMTRLEQMGATGIKVDFFLPDGQEMVNYYLDILEDAARHHLLVDFHGCTIPRGWSRTWPNLMSMESVYGAEWYNNNRRMTNAAAAHNATLPFTRNVIGPMDYTPCTFTDSQNPHITTDCHELALSILFESGLQHMADRPEAYLSLPDPVRNLLSGLPSAWDDTRLLAGYPGQSAVIARLSGDTWYIAGINGTENEITLEPDYARIGQNVVLSTLITDKGDAPGMGFNIQNDVQAGKITLPARGGFVAIVTK